MFVRARGEKFSSLGIGKLVDRRDDICFIEYFDAPVSDPIIHEISTSDLTRVELAEQTRVYYYNGSTGAWEIGRILEDHCDSQFVRFPNGIDRWLKSSDVNVRWARPITDPTLFLAGKVNETPRFADGRSRFVRSIMGQRAVSMGMPAVTSSSVELEAHQIEVVRRVLQDPVQRYLLADEVGLGKTIEAGILIRQCVLDCKDEVLILVVVPDALLTQWRTELTEKFFLEDRLDNGVHVVPFSDSHQIKSLLGEATMLVIDEAHQLTGKYAGLHGSLYKAIVAAAPNIERVLLLSATPALHNERGFMEMLHLLDPETYRLDDEAGFRRRISNRQTLAEIVAGLLPENVFFLDHTLDQLANLFADDSLLQEIVFSLREIVDRLPEENDPDLVRMIGRARIHISEVYRLHRRILRNRRKNIVGLTPERSGIIQVDYHCTASVRLYEAIENWRFEETTAASYQLGKEPRTAFSGLLIMILNRFQDCTLSGIHLESPAAHHKTKNSKYLLAISRELSRRETFVSRSDALIAALPSLIEPKQQFVVFCSDVETADALAEKLEKALGVSVERHSPEKKDWLAFNSDPNRTFLVCDHRAEEGLNLQGRRKIVIHYDLPFDPNRIEQRLGRIDRYGSGDAVRSVILLCRDNPFEVAWVEYLEKALRLFDRSVASLQYLIDDTMRSLTKSILDEGVEAIQELTALSSGEDGIVEQEIASIDHQDTLDALGTPPEDMLDDLIDVDGDWQQIDHAASAWIETNLLFDRIDEAGFNIDQSKNENPFRYRYKTSSPHTLVPLKTFYIRCNSAIDHGGDGRLATTVKTYPCTFRRWTALSHNGRQRITRLLRYGDPFVDGMWDITQADDRGRSTALLRFDPDFVCSNIADLYFRFDFVIEPDLSEALSLLAVEGNLNGSAHAAIVRRAETSLPPLFQTIWLDPELELVVEETTLDRLNRPYRPKDSDHPGRDFNLNPMRWQNLARFRLPQLKDWPAVCAAARNKAEQVLREQPVLTSALGQAKLRTDRVDHERLGQLRARAEQRLSRADEAELVSEESLSYAINKGIVSPSIRVDAIVACFLTSNVVAPLAIDRRA